MSLWRKILFFFGEMYAEKKVEKQKENHKI